ncbi:MAG: hypothetical protein KF802_00270 [Bdellovibrionaceae bacterium]|nr:hypothetical protein [Pseudobdellovibrionaceae bacterium]MBX3034805.1 hypothetical protein [Pseudobdellovibrionaceae bacterium]
MKSWLKETCQILRVAGFPALIALILSAVIDQQINQQLEALLMNEDGPGTQLWLLAGASLFNGLLFPIFATACVLYGLARTRGDAEAPLDFLERVLNQIYIEVLRSWGSALTWGLLLILPGFIRMIQLMFVPLIVVFHRAYDEGEADALRTSGTYTRRHPFRLLGYLVLFYLVIPLTLTSLLDSWRAYDSTPVAAIGCTALDLVVLILSLQTLYRLFERTRKELGDESVFPVERDPSAA